MTAPGEAERGPARLVRIRPDLREMTGYHSAQVEVEIRLNANESPLPPPQRWQRALSQAINDLPFNRYPDREATELRTALADLHGVEPEEIFCANGSNEVLQCLLLAYGGPGRRVVLFEPTYQMHHQIASVTGTKVVVGWRGEDFLIDLEIAEKTIAKADPVVTFLCSPNNPTGRVEPLSTIERVLSLAPGLVVVDEAYGQFSPESSLDFRSLPNVGAKRLVVVKTFSKTWSMAACRLGYLIAEPEVVRACELVTLPYHLNAMTQMAGVLALHYKQDMIKRVALVAEERGRVSAALADMAVDTWPSEANFVLFRPRAKSAAAVWGDLLAASILVRDCTSWPGLEECLRVTIGTPQENDRFVRALRGSLEATR